VLTHVYVLTRGPTYWQAVERASRHAWLVPLAARRGVLDGLHSNTQPPTVIWHRVRAMKRERLHIVLACGLAVRPFAACRAEEVKTHSLLTSPNGRIDMALGIDADGRPRYGARRWQACVASITLVRDDAEPPVVPFDAAASERVVAEC
jgi:hypothetical protein